jgi:hypothetical protein
VRELGAATVDGLTDIPGPPDSDSRHRQRHATIGPDARDRTATHTSHDDTAARRRDFASNAGQFAPAPALFAFYDTAGALIGTASRRHHLGRRRRRTAAWRRYGSRPELLIWF